MTEPTSFHKKFFDMFRKIAGGSRDKRELLFEDFIATEMENDRKEGEDLTGKHGDAKSFFELLEDGPLLNILEHLSTPRDLANALTVCKAWNLAGIEGQVWKSLCKKINPEALNRIVGIEDLRPPSSSNNCNRNNFNRQLTKYRRRSLPSNLANYGEGSSQSSANSLQNAHSELFYPAEGSFLPDLHSELLEKVHTRSEFLEKIPTNSLHNTLSELSQKIPKAASTNIYAELLEKLRSESQVFAALTCQLVGPRGSHNCIRHALHASSTDNDPDEGIAETLVPSSYRSRRNSPSYWSSKGNPDGDKIETLTYELVTPVCLVNEMMVQPFEAYFQRGSPIYAAKAVRFRFGYIPREDFFERPYLRRLLVDTQINPAERAIWTYESPIYPMEKSNVLQRFPLPKPVLCVGGIVQVELLGSVQTQEFDQLHYVCISHVRAIGKPLPQFMYVPVIDSESFVLQFKGQNEQGFELRDDLMPGCGIDLESRIDFINFLAKDAAQNGGVHRQNYVLQMLRERYRRALGSNSRVPPSLVLRNVLEEHGDIVEWYRREGGGEGGGEGGMEGGGGDEASSSEDETSRSVFDGGDNFDKMMERED